MGLLAELDRSRDVLLGLRKAPFEQRELGQMHLDMPVRRRAASIIRQPCGYVEIRIHGSHVAPQQMGFDSQEPRVYCAFRLAGLVCKPDDLTRDLEELGDVVRRPRRQSASHQGVHQRCRIAQGTCDLDRLAAQGITPLRPSLLAEGAGKPSE